MTGMSLATAGGVYMIMFESPIKYVHACAWQDIGWVLFGVPAIGFI
jgi:hypothetical protein